MKHIYSYWEAFPSKREGYSVAVITFDFDAIDEKGNEHFGKSRNTLKEAINDAKRYFKTHSDSYFSIYAHAILTDYYTDSGEKVRKPEEDCIRIGSLTPFGDYLDLCESADWLEEA